MYLALAICLISTGGMSASFRLFDSNSGSRVQDDPKELISNIEAFEIPEPTVETVSHDKSILRSVKHGDVVLSRPYLFGPSHGPITMDTGSSLLVNDTYFVDANFGNDTTGAINNPELPFQTIGGAVQNFVNTQPASTVNIMVRPGQYTESTNLLQGNITFIFDSGAVVLLGSTNPLFSDGGTAFAFSVLGYGIFLSTGMMDYQRVKLIAHRRKYTRTNTTVIQLCNIMQFLLSEHAVLQHLSNHSNKCIDIKFIHLCKSPG